MAFTPNSNLKHNSDVLLKDYRHASDMFNADQFRLAPKHNFLFHVAFGINKAALKNPNLVLNHGHEINMLVKNCDLPSFTIQTETLNQYNRKKVVQYQQKYSDIGIKFHDDNMGLINQLWQNYYSYYYADPTSATGQGAYARNAMQSFNSINSPYGFDNGSTTPFFNYIKIYQLARHEYVCYQLWNPIISSWNYNKLDYSNAGIRDVDMKIQYEAVSFTTGLISEGNPEGFGLTHYDTTPSPLTGQAPTGTAKPSFVNDTTPLAPGILSNAINTVNNYQNTQQSSAPASNSGGLGLAGIIGAATLATTLLPGAVNLAKSAVGGIKDIMFPGADATNDQNQNAGAQGQREPSEGEGDPTALSAPGSQKSADDETTVAQSGTNAEGNYNGAAGGENFLSSF